MGAHVEYGPMIEMTGLGAIGPERRLVRKHVFVHISEQVAHFIRAAQRKGRHIPIPEEGGDFFLAKLIKRRLHTFSFLLLRDIDLQYQYNATESFTKWQMQR
jgi:hypothetical protein